MKRIMIIITVIALIVGNCANNKQTAYKNIPADSIQVINETCLILQDPKEEEKITTEDVILNDEEFMQKVKKAIAENDKEWLANHISYPLTTTLNGQKEIVVENSQQLITHFEQIFFPAFKALIEKHSVRDLFSNWQGTMLGDGEIWIIGKEIIAINNASIKDTTPPIENITGSQWANASIQLPNNWDGKCILANGFVWIDRRDTTMQRKYGIFPDEDNYPFYDDYEIWDNDDQYYKYPLSPSVEIYAGILTDDGGADSPKRVTISQFESYLRKRKYTEGKDNGMITNVTYSNGAITKIEERFTP